MNIGLDEINLGLLLLGWTSFLIFLFKRILMQKKYIDIIFQTLQKMYAEQKTELNYSTPFQLVVAVILSAQTTDKQVNKVTTPLFKIIKDPQDVLDMGEDAFTQAIRSVNYYKTKGKNIYGLSGNLKEKEERKKSSSFPRQELERESKSKENGFPPSRE